jgi:AcrR family transcriptional regulator
VVPKIVDHDQRREEIVAAVWRVIARDGIANTTMRQIAMEAGYSNGVLAHYFSNKEDLMASALLMAHRGVRERTDRRIGRRRGLDALRTLMVEALPLTKQGLIEAKIEASFWGEALGSRSLRRLQNREVDGFRERMRARLAEAETDGELADGIDLDLVAHECLVLVDGLSIQAVMYPAQASRDEQLGLLDALLSRIARTSVTPEAGGGHLAAGAPGR